MAECNDTQTDNQKVPICRRCRRRLKTPEAIERGMGKVCYQKSQTSEVKKPLFQKEIKNETH